MFKLEKSGKITILFLSWRDIKAPKKGGAEVFTHQMLKRINLDKYRIIHFSPEFMNKKEEKSNTDEIIDGIKYLRKGNSISVIYFAMKFYKNNRGSIDYVVDQCNTHRFFTKFWVEKNKRIFFIHQLTREIWFKNIKFPFSLIGYLTEIPFLKFSKKDPTITVSNSTKESLIKFGFDKSKIFILPEGIDFKPWNKDKFYPKEKDYTFIYVGRYSNYKGIDKTVEAFAKVKHFIPKAKLWIVGKKDEKYINEILLPILEEYKVSISEVIFWGFVTEKKKLELMSKAHVLVFPSLREGWGLIITEAAAVGTPSIGFNSPGIRDAIDMGNAGFLCQENNVDEIVNKMLESFTNKEKYLEIQNKSYEFSKKFHWDYTAQAFENFMKKLMEEPQKVGEL